MPGIIVGVDGSADSQPVLGWAIKEAGLRRAALTVLAVHQVASNHWTGNPGVEPGQPETEKTRLAAQGAVEKAVSAAGEPGPVSVTVRAVSASAVAQELINASAGSDLVVVGSGSGESKMVLGSASSQVVSHAQGPVVIIPPSK